MLVFSGLAACAALMALTIGSVLAVLYLCDPRSAQRSRDSKQSISGGPYGADSSSAGAAELARPLPARLDSCLSGRARLVVFRPPVICQCNPKVRSPAFLWRLALAAMIFFVAQFPRWIVPRRLQLVPAYVSVTMLLRWQVSLLQENLSVFPLRRLIPYVRLVPGLVAPNCSSH
jgi:hypothetical protein